MTGNYTHLIHLEELRKSITDDQNGRLMRLQETLDTITKNAGLLGPKAARGARRKRRAIRPSVWMQGRIMGWTTDATRLFADAVYANDHTDATTLDWMRKADTMVPHAAWEALSRRGEKAGRRRSLSAFVITRYFVSSDLGKDATMRNFRLEHSDAFLQGALEDGPAEAYSLYAAGGAKQKKSKKKSKKAATAAAKKKSSGSKPKTKRPIFNKRKHADSDFVMFQGQISSRNEWKPSDDTPEDLWALALHLEVPKRPSKNNRGEPYPAGAQWPNHFKKVRGIVMHDTEREMVAVKRQARRVAGASGLHFHTATLFCMLVKNAGFTVAC